MAYVGLAVGEKNKALMTKYDQQLLNAVLHGHWKEISPIWNWQQPVRSPVFESIVPVAISHFIGKVKPWHFRPHAIAPRFYLPLFGFLKQHFPDAALAEMPKVCDFDRSYIRKLSFKNLFRTRELKKYLDRFPDDLGV